MAAPYRRPARTMIDYGAAAHHDMVVLELRRRVRARQRRRAWTPLRRLSAMAAPWLLLCVLVGVVFYALAPWLSLVVP
jgi:hypothetical protein